MKALLILSLALGMTAGAAEKSFGASKVTGGDILSRIIQHQEDPCGGEDDDENDGQ